METFPKDIPQLSSLSDRQPSSKTACRKDSLLTVERVNHGPPRDPPFSARKVPHSARRLLLPFEAILKTTQGIFNKLSEDREVKKLEYNPGEVQRFFASLPNDDDRKHLWKSYIEWLQTENRRAVELIERFYGRIVLKEFKDACDEFLAHAKEWELVRAIVFAQKEHPLA
jgi:hypothetical protein